MSAAKPGFAPQPTRKINFRSDDETPSRVRRIGGWLTTGTRWGLGGVLVLAPWLYGTTQGWTMDLMANLLFVLWGLFALLLPINRRLPRVPWPAAALSIALLAWGWGMAQNGLRFNSTTWENYRVVPSLPGSEDASLSLSCMKLLTGMLAVFWITSDLAANPIWRSRIWSIIGCTGASIALLGIVQRVTGAHDIFWGGERYLETFFATYRYHGNAGAYINLVLPFIICRTVASIRSEKNQLIKGFWCLATLVTLAAAFVDASRGAFIVTVAMLGGFGIWLTAKLVIFVARKGVHASMVGALAILIAAVILLAIAGGSSSAFDRFQDLELNPDGRDEVYKVIWDNAIPESGLSGFGPGTFQATYQHFSPLPEIGAIPIWWVYAHEDYLQTIMEWGWGGAALWAGLFFGGLGYGISKLLRSGRNLSTDSRLLLAASVVSLGGVLAHSLVDFPLQMASLQIYAAIALGFAWSVGKSSRNGSERRRQPG